MTARAYVYPVQAVVRVVDGDTAWLRVDVGFRFHALVNVRVMGIDCPEARQGSPLERVRGAQARVLTTAWLLARPQLWLRTEPDPDSFGRWLGDIWTETPSGDEHLTQALLDAGLATAWPTRWRAVYDPP